MTDTLRPLQLSLERVPTFCAETSPGSTRLVGAGRPQASSFPDVKRSWEPGKNLHNYLKGQTNVNEQQSL